MPPIKRKLAHIDWLLFGAATFLTAIGIITMSSFTGNEDFSTRQIIWAALSLIVFFSASLVDWRFLRSTVAVTAVFLLSVTILLLLVAVGSVFGGARSWFDFGFFVFQPTDLAKLSLILVLAKYFARRHVEIAHVRHIIVSGFYTLVILLLVFIQPDFGSAVIVGCIWLGLLLVSGISKKHLAAVFAITLISGAVLWNFGFEQYQKQRIISFLHPLADIQGAGYNAYQSTIAVGSGQFFGKGIGYGTQSKLKFLPEYETDFIFASFAEEWGFVGVALFFLLYGIVIWRVLLISYRGETNFEILFGLGVAIFLVSHFLVHVGMNIGLLPVTGIGLPFLSYGGSHLLSVFLSLGILNGMKKYARAAHKETISDSELVEVYGTRES